jgi:hypothetical protein
VRIHPVDKLLERHCYKSATGLLQLVRFYVFSLNVGLTMCDVNDLNSLLLHFISTTHVKTHKLFTGLQTSWNKLLMALSYLLQGCSDKSDTVMI